ncbi:MAG: SMP-30/gluconolactonase/LRE family protein [Betaproteobacteria bacterium]
MYSAPLSLTTETAFELPGYLHESGAGNPWVAANLNGKDIHSFLGGPCFDGFGNLWVVDTPFGRIFRITRTGEWDLIVKYDGWPTGLKFHPDGRLVIADQRHGLLEMDTDSRKIAPLVTHFMSQRFKGVKDITIAREGDIYFTDQGQTGLHDASGAAYRLKIDGVLQQLLGGIPGPDGLVLSDDENSLFMTTRENAVWRLPLVDAGVSRVSKYIQLSGGMGGAGLASDHDNNIYVAHYGMGCVWQFDKRGEPKNRIDSSRGDLITNLTIDPQHPNQLYITESQTGSVLRATLPLY